MPAQANKREQTLIEWFVLGYENSTWAESEIDRLDERFEGAVEALVTHADGRTIAIEHTLIEPFTGDKKDFAAFEENEFLRIERDTSLPVPGSAIWVYVPVGVLDGKKRARRKAIVDSIHHWIVGNRLRLREGNNDYQCDIAEGLPVTLTIKLVVLGASTTGKLFIRRQQVKNDLDQIIEKALLRKLPKLTRTKADKRLLFLERQHFTFFPELIFNEIERQRPRFPLLNQVEEIWHIETIAFETEGIVYFERRIGTQAAESFVVNNGALM